MQVELYVQDRFAEFQQPKTINGDDTGVEISVETWENWFERWLDTLQFDIPQEAPIYEIGLRLTDDTEMQSLNAQYRHKNQPTDVLSFAALEVDYPQTLEMLTCEALYLGDIVISVDTAKRQAAQQNHPLQTELAWLASHGLLHLLGWDHPDERSLSKMLRQQVVLLEHVGISIDVE
ncbi:rRNA maturation RNase YbeY [Aetokthonos hydrillicola Thurmond2011]|uniref:Endoribonuclease YbeY n=1 Tax=Aetokthonos hydrillicola Thurmond2011 TaxID=2712845 RepID=A0AAP5IBD4_9CYAN|nr:rRNA maturation RNase YbeY [Aetokthonos hydrillicola]MBO3462543.1 rRNA maturation RNase YbeY [Aetokthonos hydrillicola CCALA 1050]MBW4589818.1 rRNA maturation RNase YbeY [Aetokthonos hydrillicola CCALA 1050]MDR9898388.1 rRNA maturation RNase YbeY [Aetokthonos hydrillicola Thurmond2011]